MAPRRWTRRKAALVEWLVRCCEIPVTRQKGILDLFGPSRIDVREPEEFASALTWEQRDRLHRIAGEFRHITTRALADRDMTPEKKSVLIQEFSEAYSSLPRDT